jgi:ferredoxin
VGIQPALELSQQILLERTDLDRLIDTLRQRGYRVVGPQLRDGAIVYDTLDRAATLPDGWIDEQEAGTYRLRRDGRRLFGYTVGVTSWKRFLYPPRAALWRARTGVHGIEHLDAPHAEAPMALLGVRPCELAAMRIHDRVLLEGPWPDPVYRARRAAAFVIVVQCGRAGATCFCASMGTGPRADAGFDLAMTEIPQGDSTAFVTVAGSPKGEAVLAALAGRPASEPEAIHAEGACREAEKQMGRTVDTRGLAAAILSQPEHPRWAATAERCLACGNCTQVCPTCFCTSIEDRCALDGTAAERTRRWDSCFAPDFSYIHGGSVRPSVRARYRHWLTHKLATWHEQFGSSGCVGCGRCITWCPAGIDITEEARALQAGVTREETSHADA